MVLNQKVSKAALDRLISCNQKTIDLYSKHLPRSSADPQIWELINIRNDHKKMNALLRRLMHDLGESSEVQVSNTELWQASELSKSLYLMEDHAVLNSFLESEIIQIEECERILDKSKQISEAIKQKILEVVLPKLRLHIDLLEQLLGQLPQKAIL